MRAELGIRPTPFHLSRSVKLEGAISNTGPLQLTNDAITGNTTGNSNGDNGGAISTSGGTVQLTGF